MTFISRHCAVFILAVLLLAECAQKDTGPAEAVQAPWNTAGISYDAERSVFCSTEKMDLDTIYRIGLGYYLKEKLDLASYEKEIKEAGCVEVSAEAKKKTQARDRTGTKYIYVRNDMNMNILSPEDIETLKSGDVYSDGSLSDEMMEIVIRTFPDVIRAVRTTENDPEMTMYDTDIYGEADSSVVPVGALVFQIATQPEYDENGYEVSPEEEDRKEDALYSLSQRMEEEMKGKLGNVPVRVNVDRVR